MTDLLKEIQAPPLRQLFAYWHDQLRGRVMPSMRDLDPADFEFARDFALLIDVVEEPLGFRIRLHGSELARQAGYDMTGKMVDELPGAENRSVLLRRCHDLVSKRQPLVVRSERVVDGRMIHYEAVWMPVSDDGERVTMLLGGLFYGDPPSRSDPPQATH